MSRRFCFQQSTNEYTIDIGSTIIDFYSIYEYASFTLDMGVDNLENFDEEGNYNYNISVEATSEKLGNSSDAVDVPVDIRYSHGSWSITSMINPTNAINILNSTNASVSIDFSHSECEDYLLYGTLYFVPDGNMDIFTLDYISRNIYIEESPYSTGESFDVIGCSDNLNDIFVDIIFDGDEYHSASYSLTSYALAVSNMWDEISMFTGFEDADNDGTNNINDLDNAGSFMPFLVKTHESATSAFFRFDFDDTKVIIWKKDGNMTRTNSVDEIQDGVSYSYGDLFEDGAELELYVQALESGEHNVEVTYLLDGHELDSKNVSFTFAELKIKCNDVCTNSITVNVGQKISLEASFEPDVFDNVVFQWDIPGYNNFTPDVIKNYITTAEQGTVETLEWNDFDESTVDFYWVKAVTNNVECIATVDGEDYTRTISFSVQKPTCSFTSSLTTNIPPVGVRTNFFPPVPELVYGSKHISQGITFYPEVTTGDTGSGTIALFQLISLDIESLGTETFVCSSENNYIIDSIASSYGISILYGGYETMVANNETKMHTNPNSEYISDSPAIRFDTFELQIETYVPIVDANIYHVSRYDDFKIYVMYKPSSDNSIWIPLSKMTWLWGGQASKGTNEIWTLDAGSGNSLSVPPIGYDTLEFPVWTRNFQDEIQDITIK